jgi:signal transduction histidine kinase
LQNIVKHAHASHVWVSLDAQDSDVVLSVEDDGAGFQPGAVRGTGGLGLISMEERARLAGGTLSIESAPGKGTRISVIVPGSQVTAGKTEHGGIVTPLN